MRKMLLSLFIFFGANLHSEIDASLVAPNIGKNLQEAMLAAKTEFVNLELEGTPLILGAVILGIVDKIPGFTLSDIISVGKNWGIDDDLFVGHANSNMDKIASLIASLFKEKNISESAKDWINYKLEDDFCVSLLEAGLEGHAAICNMAVEQGSIRIKVVSCDNEKYEIYMQKLNGDGTYSDLSITRIAPNMLGKQSNLTEIHCFIDKLLPEFGGQLNFFGVVDLAFAFSTNKLDSNCEGGARACLVVNFPEPIAVKMPGKFSLKVDASDKSEPTFKWFFFENSMLFNLNIGALQFKPEVMGELSLERLRANIIVYNDGSKQSSKERPSLLIEKLSLAPGRNFLSLDDKLHFALDINQGLIVDLIKWWGENDSYSLRASPLTFVFDFFNRGSLSCGSTHEKVKIEVKGQGQDNKAMFIFSSKAKDAFESKRMSSLSSIFAMEDYFSRMAIGKDLAGGNISAEAGSLSLSYTTAIVPKKDVEENISMRKLSLNEGENLLFWH